MNTKVIQKLGWRVNARLRKLMKKYVVVKPHIQKIVDNFVNENFNSKNVIGCHVRGTDFAYATATSGKIF